MRHAIGAFVVTIGALIFTLLWMSTEGPGRYGFFVFPVVAFLLALSSPSVEALCGCLAAFVVLGLCIPLFGSFGSPGGAYVWWVVVSAGGGAAVNSTLRFAWRLWRRAQQTLGGDSRKAARASS